jgi:hypothetical protein
MVEQGIPVIFENKTIGYVWKMNSTDFTSRTSVKNSNWAGKFETIEDAKNNVIERYKVVRWSAV